MKRKQPHGAAAPIPFDGDVSSVSVVMFIPSVDKYQQEIDQDYWVAQGLEFFGRTFGGATALGPAKGIWYENSDSVPVFDCPYMLLCYAKKESLTDSVMYSVVDFVKKLGIGANQGEVGIVFDNQYWGLRDYGQSDT